MTRTTAPLADWELEAVDSEAVAMPAVTRTLATGDPEAKTLDLDKDHLKRLAEGEPLTPDPTARERMAAALHKLTGWDFPEVGHDRAYVSRLWAEDWDSAEDAAYDE